MFTESTVRKSLEYRNPVPVVSSAAHSCIKITVDFTGQKNAGKKFREWRIIWSFRFGLFLRSFAGSQPRLDVLYAHW